VENYRYRRKKMSADFEYALALGTNLGHKQQNIEEALVFLSQAPFRLGKVSAMYQTAPWGFTSDNGFLNACVQVFSSAPPLEVLKLVKGYEKEKGRIKQTAGYTDRVIDIDILFCNNTFVLMKTPELQLPHPHLHQRAFVLKPLLDIYPNWIHPVLNKTVKQMLEEVGSGGSSGSNKTGGE